MNIVWLHGWGQNKRLMEPLGTPFKSKHNCLFLDLPGFGEAEKPDTVWGSDDYADYVARTMQNSGIDKALFVGHSIGGKIALQMAIRHPEHTEGIVMIAASGLRRKRSLRFKIWSSLLKMMAKTAGFLDSVFKTKFKQAYGRKFGSADYRNAEGVMRDILVKNIHEDMSLIAPFVTRPTLIVYGEKDKDTPPEVGRKYHALIRSSSYIELPNQDHYTIIQDGRAQTQNLIQQFIDKLLQSQK